MNYVRALVRSSEYRQMPDLNPVRHVLYQGRFWLRVDGWRKPERDTKLLMLALLFGAIALGGLGALVADLL